MTFLGCTDRFSDYNLKMFRSIFPQKFFISLDLPLLICFYHSIFQKKKNIGSYKFSLWNCDSYVRIFLCVPKKVFWSLLLKRPKTCWGKKDLYGLRFNHISNGCKVFFTYKKMFYVDEKLIFLRKAYDFFFHKKINYIHLCDVFD